MLKNETTFVFYSEPSLYSATPAVVSIFGDSRLLIAATVPHSLKDEPITIRFQRVNEVETHLTATGFARNSITAKSELDTSRKPARRSDRDRDDDVMVFIECVTPQFMPRETAAADGHDREGDARNSSDSESGTSSTTSEEDWSDVDEEGTQGIVTPVDMGGDVYIAISFNRGENFHSLKPSSSERLKLALYRALVATDFQLVQTSVPVGDCGSPVRLCVGVVRSPNTRPLLPALATSSCALLRVTPLSGVKRTSSRINRVKRPSVAPQLSRRMRPLVRVAQHQPATLQEPFVRFAAARPPALPSASRFLWTYTTLSLLANFRRCRTSRLSTSTRRKSTASTRTMLRCYVVPSRPSHQMGNGRPDSRVSSLSNSRQTRTRPCAFQRRSARRGRMSWNP